MVVRSSVAILLWASFVTSAATQSGTPIQTVTLPAVGELKDGWNQLRPGGETTCAKGAPYHFYVRRGSPEKLLVFFEGGGACWRGGDCERGQPIYTPEIPSGSPGVDSRRRGILDLAHPENPFADRSAIVVPYCTGDVHLGDSTATYTITRDGGDSRSFTIHHRGQVNAMTVLRWIYANFAAPREIFVTGSSAGGFATPFYASVLAQHYPKARVDALGDDAGMLHGRAITGMDFSRWGHPGVVRRYRGWEKLPEDWGTPDLFVIAARSASNLKIFQIDHANDQVQYSYIVLSAVADMSAALKRQQAGVQGSELVGLLRANRKEIGALVDTFRSFIVGGRAHTNVQNDRFYAYQTNGQRVRDWVASIANGQAVASVDCTNCWRPEFRFTSADLRIVERAVELLSPPGVWDPQDGPGACPESGSRYTLRCALRKAAGDVTGVIPDDQDPAAVWEVRYSVFDRMGTRERWFESNALVVYNNRPGTAAADVIGLLQEVRDRISAEMRQRVKQ